MRKDILISFLMVLLIAAAAAAAAEGSTFHGDEQRTGNFTSGEILPVLVWKQKLTGLVGAMPVYSGGKVYVANWYGWGSWNPGLYALNASTGEIIWRNENITGASTAAISGDTIVIGNLSGELYYVNASSGEILKAIKLESNPSYWGVASSPLIYNGSVYVTTFSNGTLWKLDMNGSVVWKYTSGGEIAHYSSPAASDRLIFSAGNESGKHTLYAVYENGTLAWKFDVDSEITNTPSVGDGKVFFATKSRLYAVNFEGEEVWNVSFNGTMSTAAIAHGKIFVGSKDGKLYCLNATNGKVEWVFNANGKIDSSAAFANGVVYFATNTQEGTIYAVSETGDLLWYYRLKPPSGSYYNIMSSPFIADNKLYIGADSGYVYCFGTEGKLEFNVTLIPGKIDIKAKSGKTYKINATSALAALYKASSSEINVEEGKVEVRFEITLDDEWYGQYGSFLVDSIMGITNAADWSKWWSVWNETALIPVGANLYDLSNGETIYYCYGDGKSLGTCGILLAINATVKPAGISSFATSSGSRGGNVTVWVNVSSAENNWYVLVVSGVNENGEAIAGISTFYLRAGEELEVPVLIYIPQLAQTGTYRLYAGVYRFEEYPTNLIHIYGPESCRVE